MPNNKSTSHLASARKALIGTCSCRLTREGQPENLCIRLIIWLDISNPPSPANCGVSMAALGWWFCLCVTDGLLGVSRQGCWLLPRVLPHRVYQLHTMLLHESRDVAVWLGQALMGKGCRRGQSPVWIGQGLLQLDGGCSSALKCLSEHC